MPFVKGQSGNPTGKPRGAKDKHPRSAKRVIQELLEQFGSNTELLTTVFRRGLEAKPPTSFAYLKLLIEQQLGAPDQTVKVLPQIVFKEHDANR